MKLTQLDLLGVLFAWLTGCTLTQAVETKDALEERSDRLTAAKLDRLCSLTKAERSIRLKRINRFAVRAVVGIPRCSG